MSESDNLELDKREYILKLIKNNKISISIKDNKFMGYYNHELGIIKKTSSSFNGLIDEFIFWKFIGGINEYCKLYKYSFEDGTYITECNRILCSPLLQSHDSNLDFKEFYKFCPYCGKSVFKIGH